MSFKPRLTHNKKQPSQVRQAGRNVSVAIPIAVVNTDGAREILGICNAEKERRTDVVGIFPDDPAIVRLVVALMWTDFCAASLAAGLRGVKLVISDAHLG